LVKSKNISLSELLIIQSVKQVLLRLKMMNKIFILMLLILTDCLYSQVKNDTIYVNSIPCNSINEIKIRNLDSIEVLFLWSMQLRTIPKEVLLCKNLLYLDLTNTETEDEHLDDLSSKRRKKVERIIIGNKNKVFDDKEFNNFHANKITTLPDDFFKLSSLKLLNVEENSMSNKLIKKIRKRMPNCYVLTNQDDEKRLELPIIKIRPWLK
jgi:hypothetical protein